MYVYEILKQAQLTYGEKNINPMVVHGRMGQQLARMDMEELSGLAKIFQILAVIWVM